MIVVIDYGLGNIHSVIGAVEKLGFQAISSSKTEDFEKANKLILPGVGAFSDGMANLRNLGLIEPLTRLVVKEKKPLLGICLGCQLLCKESFEFGHHQGLGWIDASVIKLVQKDSEHRIPHVGWDDLDQVKESPLLTDVPKKALFYYTHSFQVTCHDRSIVLGTCDYGQVFDAAVQQGNIFGTQFHPEKSQADGLRLLKNFLEKC